MFAVSQIEAIRLSCMRQHKTLFADVSFILKNGELLLIEGPNGAGKSSLLRMLAGLSTPHHGNMLWNGNSIKTACEEMHYIGHANGIKTGLTVAENLNLAKHLSDKPYIARLDDVLQTLQLYAYKNTQLRFLSAGQKRRTALAKLFLLQKTLWILDEPFTALDKDMQLLFLAQLKQHIQAGGIAILSSHHPVQIKDVAMKSLRLALC